MHEKKEELMKQILRRMLALSLMLAVLALLSVSCGEEDVTIQWKTYEDHWEITRVQYLGIQPTGDSTIRHAPSPQEAVDETGAFISSMGTSYRMPDKLPADLKVTTEALEEAVGRKLAGDEWHQVELIFRPMDKGEFFHRIDLHYADTYLIEQTLFRKGTADVVDPQGAVLKGDAAYGDLVMDQVTTTVYLGVPPAIHIVYYRLDELSDLTRLQLDPTYPAKYQYVDSQIYVMKGNGYARLDESSEYPPQEGFCPPDTGFTSPASP